MKKRKAISIATAISIVFLFGAASTLSAYEEENSTESVKLDYDRIEELPDGGKIYFFSIGGIEHKFPVPPDGFSPLTADNEQLETYGFPSRPDKKNAEEYADWVEIMSSYRSTPIPEIELINEGDTDEEDNGISPQIDNTAFSENGAGYAAVLEDNSNEYFAHVQGDFVQPTITATLGSCANMFVVGFDTIQGRTRYPDAGLVAGTRCIGTGKAYAYYHCYGKDGKDTSYVNTKISFSPGDKVHVYVSYQRANNIFNYYIVNMTKGTQVSDIVQFDNANYYKGKNACWLAGRCKTSANTYYNLGKFTNVQFSNCKAMLNTSDTWTNLGDYKKIKNISLQSDFDRPKLAAATNSLVNKNQFTCMWIRYNEYY